MTDSREVLNLLNKVVTMVGEDLSNITKLGMDSLGQGHFSRVYEYGEYAIKIGGVCAGGFDAGYMYAKWCKEHDGVPFVPKVHAVTRHTEKAMYVVIMDKYIPAREVTYDKNAVRATTESVRCGEVQCNALPGTAEFVEAFRGVRGAGNIDLHDDNYMFTADGELVLTDPLSFGSYDHDTEACSGARCSNCGCYHDECECCPECGSVDCGWCENCDQQHCCCECVRCPHCNEFID